MGRTYPTVLDLIGNTPVVRLQKIGAERYYHYATWGGGLGVLSNLQRKMGQADEMFARLVQHMYESLEILRPNPYLNEMRLPRWL
jgi:hypothetical protein